MNTRPGISFRLAATALLFGAFTMLAQVLLLRALLSAVEENEILVALFYGSWFFGIFLGAAVAQAFQKPKIRGLSQAVCPRVECEIRGLSQAVCPRVDCEIRGLSQAVCPRVDCKIRGLSQAVCPEIRGLSQAVCPEIRGLSQAVCPRVDCPRISRIPVDCPRISVDCPRIFIPRISRISILLVLQAALLPLALISIRTIHATLGLPAAEPIPFARLAPIVLAHAGPLGFLTGLIFPLLCALAEIRGLSQAVCLEIRGLSQAVCPEIRGLSQAVCPEIRGLSQAVCPRVDCPRISSSSMARIFAWESLGACAAGAAFTFLLAGFGASTTLACILAALISANAAFVSRSLPPEATFEPAPHGSAQPAKPTRLAGLFLLCALIFLVLATPPLARRIESWTVARWWRPYGPGLTLVTERETRLQRVALARQGSQFSLLCNGRFTASFPDPPAETTLAQLLLAERPRPRRVLLIGGLAGGLAKHFLAAGAEAIDITEIDAELMPLLVRHLPAEDRRALSDPRVHLVHVDARWHLKWKSRQQTGAGSYDLVVGSTPAPVTLALGRTFTREFFAEARACLAPGGVLAIPLAAAVGYYGPEVSGLAGSVARALWDVFPQVIAAPGATILFMASAPPPALTIDPDELARRWEGQGLHVEGFSPLYFRSAFDLSPTRQLAASLAHWKREAVPNTDLNPVGTFHALRVWSRTSATGTPARAGASTLEWLFAITRRITLKMIFFFLTCALLAWFTVFQIIPAFFNQQSAISNLQSSFHIPQSAIRNPQFHLAALLVIATTGAASIGISILLMLAFQSLIGYLYQALGALAALFMGGLWLGSRVARRAAPRPRLRLALCELGWAAFALAAALILKSAFAHSAALSFPLAAFILGALMLSAGAISGAEFVLAGQLYERQSPASGLQPSCSTPAAINAADHLGACAGALLTGLVLLPALGLPGALIALAALKLSGALICLGRGIPS